MEPSLNAHGSTRGRVEWAPAESAREHLSIETRDEVSYIVPGKKPRLIHISIKPAGTAAFSVGTLRRKSTDFALHVELGGITGVVAPIVGKQPPDFHIWLQDGKPPAFIREEGALYEGGPI